MKRLSDFSVIAFDADDTLWDCQSHFERVEERLYELIAPWSAEPKKELFATESANMADLGYGCKAFTLSVLETAMRVSHGHIATAAVMELLQLGKQLLHLPATPLPGVTETLTALQRQGHRMVVFTKGELQDQENKLRRSGLADFFEHVEITSDKSEREFRLLCRHLNTEAERLLMVGNSFRSDIAPALAIGAWAVHIPFHVTWQLEHAEEFEHERCLKLGQFSDLIKLTS